MSGTRPNRLGQRRTAVKSRLPSVDAPPVAPLTTLAIAETRARQFVALAKPRVVSLIVFTAVIGMFLAAPGIPPAEPVLFGTIGIALVAGAAAAINCLIEQNIDKLMRRTSWRPLPRGQITSGQTLAFALFVGATGLAILYALVN